MKEGNTWYVFATARLPAAGSSKSAALPTCTNGRRAARSSTRFHRWIQQRSPGTKELWAPDISFVNGEYRLYYAYSLFGKNTSGIALATNKTLDFTSPNYRWVDQGLVLESKASDNFNAIDPNFIRDENGHDWLAFGSFWDGIKMRRLDDKTGKLSTTDTQALLTRAPRQTGRRRARASGPAAQLGGGGSSLHRPPQSLLLSLYLVGPLLPRHEEHLQNHGGPCEVRHRALRR